MLGGSPGKEGHERTHLSKEKNTTFINIFGIKDVK